MKLINAIFKPPPKAAVETDDRGNATVALSPGAALMATHNRQAMVTQIQTLAGLPAQHFDELYRDCLSNFAGYVQLMPASETHHHARLGGLLDHSLDVAHRALSLRRGHLLPPNGPPESTGREADRWTFAVFTAALLHDVGKPAANQVVELFDGAGRLIGKWNGLVGPIAGAERYRIAFRGARLYEDHTAFGPFLARAILPEVALAWLSEDLRLMKVWVAALSGDYDRAGALGSIVKKADGLSVATDVGANTQSLLPTATRVPLHEKLLNMLRRLLDEGELPINRPGGGAWITESDVWVVSKRGLETLRNRLQGEGHKDIPGRNERLMDVLMEFGLCRARGDRAIWRARVIMESFDHELTFLRFPIETVWPDPERRPEPFVGSITPDGEEPSEAPTASSAAPTETPADIAISGEAGSGPNKAAAPWEEEPAKESREESARAGGAVAEIPSFGDSAPIGNDHEEPSQETVDTPAVKEPEGFLTWLREGLAEELLEVNTSAAVVHSVREGLFMVSPKIFKKYSGHDGPWGNVQKRLLKAKVHRRNRSGNNIIEYRVEGSRRNSVIKGILIRDPEELLEMSLPEPNAHLTLDSELM